MFQRRVPNATPNRRPAAGGLDLSLMTEMATAGTAGYAEHKVPSASPNFLYRSLAASWAETNQFVPITTDLIAQFAARLRDSGSTQQARDAFTTLADRGSREPRRRARLIKVIIDAINGSPRSPEEPILDQMLSKWTGKSVKVRPTNEIIERLYANSFGWNVLERFMNDRAVTEIMVDGFDQIFIERTSSSLASGVVDSGLAFESPKAYSEFIQRLCDEMGHPINQEHPMVDFVLSDGSRGNATMFVSDQPSLTIRRPQRSEVWTLANLASKESLTPDMAEFMHQVNVAGANLITYGETGSGKTTLLGALIDDKPKIKRIVTVEDTREIFIDRERHPNTVNLESRGMVKMRDLVVNALRMRPDIIVVGETRDATAYDLLQALSVGAQGSMSTLHANSPRNSLDRLASLILQANVGLSERSVRQMVADAINIVVYAQRLPSGRRVIGSIDEVAGLDENGAFALVNVFKVSVTKDDQDVYHHKHTKNPDYMMGHSLRVLFQNKGMDPRQWSPDDPTFEAATVDEAPAAEAAPAAPTMVAANEAPDEAERSTLGPFRADGQSDARVDPAAASPKVGNDRSRGPEAT